MKKILLISIVLLLICSFTSVHANDIYDGYYTDSEHITGCFLTVTKAILPYMENSENIGSAQWNKDKSDIILVTSFHCSAIIYKNIHINETNDLQILSTAMIAATWDLMPAISNMNASATNAQLDIIDEILKQLYKVIESE